jgi:hypothetical protein
MDPLGILIGRHEPLYQSAQQLTKVLKIPVAYLYCDGDDLAEALLQVSSASGDHTLHTIFSPFCVTLLNCHSILNLQSGVAILSSLIFM